MVAKRTVKRTKIVSMGATSDMGTYVISEERCSIQIAENHVQVQGNIKMDENLKNDYENPQRQNAQNEENQKYYYAYSHSSVSGSDDAKASSVVEAAEGEAVSNGAYEQDVLSSTSETATTKHSEPSPQQADNEKTVPQTGIGTETEKVDVAEVIKSELEFFKQVLMQDLEVKIEAAVKATKESEEEMAKKRKLEEKLDKLEQKLDDKKSECKELQANNETLKSEKEAAERKADETAKELKNLQASWITLEASKNTVENNNATLQVRANQAEEALKQEQQKCQELQDKADKLQQQVVSHSANHESLRKKQQELEVKLIEKGRIISDLQQEKSQAEENLSNKEAECAALTADKTQLIASLEEQKEANIALTDEKTKVEEALKAQQEANYDLYQAKTEVEAELKEKSETYDSLACEKSNLETNLKNEKKANQQLSSEKSDLEAEVDDLMGKKAKLKKQIEELEKELKKQNMDYAKLAEGKKDVEAELSVKTEACSAMESAKAKVEVVLTSWQENAKIYLPALAALQACELFQPVVEKYALEGDTVDAQFRLITAIGRSIDFAKLLCKTSLDAKNLAVKQKNMAATEMTEEEIEVYVAVNACYRQCFGIDFDVFRAAGNQDIGTEFTKVPFNKDEVENLQDPKVKNLKYAQKTLVPVLYSPETGKIFSRGQVKAGNN